MKKIFLSSLRDKNCSQVDFRKATEEISDSLAHEAASYLPRESYMIETPIEKTLGERFKSKQVIIPILRAGLAMLPSFLKVFPDAKVGFFGLKRDEHTFEAKLYYENLPPIDPSDDVLVIDPMIATGGSGIVALEHLKAKGVEFAKITFIGIVASPEGIKALESKAPGARIVVAAVDAGLNETKFIVPGLGDFGDRYFGTV